jgi:hypothetical protein
MDMLARTFGIMSLLDLALLPFNVARRVAGAVVYAVAAPPSPDLVVVDGMPEGVPPAALRLAPTSSRGHPQAARGDRWRCR